ncbi:Uncharacterised protein [Mobiluncus curtisii]|uniref:Uncharacterized protein n=1 Tax=Mobiluncus curtisii TaxID=2051 RepID=A0A2X2YL57_9ACTO|nr:Uncharacterised protein [Mobiluncus curtisii]
MTEILMEPRLPYGEYRRLKIIRLNTAMCANQSLFAHTGLWNYPG